MSQSQFPKMDERIIDETISFSGENIRKTISLAFHNWSNMVPGNTGAYDGIYEISDGRDILLLAAPEKYLAQAGILALEIGELDPVWVHASIEALEELGAMKKQSIAKSLHIGTVRPVDKLLESTRHDGIRSLCDQAGADNAGVYYYSLHNQAPKLMGPKRVDAQVYSIDDRILHNFDPKSVKLRSAHVSDVDRLGSLIDLLRGASGLELQYSYNKNNVVSVSPTRRYELSHTGNADNNLIDPELAYALLGL